MLKEYLGKQQRSIYSVAKESGIPYSTLNDLANGKVEIDSCKVSVLMALAAVLGLSIEEAYSVCRSDVITVRTSYDVEATVTVRNKSYYTNFCYNDVPVELELCKVNDDTSYYIESIAKWRAERYIRELRMKEFR